MESVPLKDARGRLGKIHSAAAHGQPVEITRHGSAPVVVVSKTMYDVMFTDHLRWQAEQFRKALDEGAVPEGTLVIHRDDLDRWRDATPEEWAAGKLDA
ncbi:type II toxin-antitoxin system prevent-host-death family antitoxin [Spirillospora sp. NPDC047418]|jgi:prevent-host-death family protein